MAASDAKLSPATTCLRYASTISSASSLLRVMVASFQLEGFREPRCLTSRCEARILTSARGFSGDADAEGGPARVQRMVYGPISITLPFLTLVGLLGEIFEPSRRVPVRDDRSIR